MEKWKKVEKIIYFIKGYKNNTRKINRIQSLMSNSNLLSVFNDHFVEFVTDIQNVFPKDHDILMAKNSLLAIRKANPKMIVKIWKTYIVDKYQQEIESGNLDFFLKKDYSQDLASSENSGKIIESINRLREPIRQMSEENQQKTLKYIQNLTKLTILIHSSSTFL